MNFDDTIEEAAYRTQVHNWLQANAPHHLAAELRSAPLFSLDLKSGDSLAIARAWQQKKFDAGWACIHWPKYYGGQDANAMQRVIWEQEEGDFRKLTHPFLVGIGLAAPTLMAYATEAQKLLFLPRIASGEDVWCQLFSEPGAGSDLAGIRTKAVRDGDAWIVNGQKVWTSWAHAARYGVILVRTDPNLPKHKGLTAFFLDMTSAGVTVNPIKQLNGKAEFNEVYFDNVRIPDTNRLGNINDGWRVSLHTLMHERMPAPTAPTGVPQLFELCRNARNVDGTRWIDDRAVRSKLAHLTTVASGLQYTAYRSITSLSRGQEPGPENSISKLIASNTLQDVTRYALDLMGAAGQLVDAPEHLGGGWFQSMFLRSPGLRIEGGSDEILRNIIAERVLGLPAEARDDKNTPFNQLS